MAQESRNRTPLIYLGVAVFLFLLFAVRIAYLVIVEKDGSRDYQDPVVAHTVVRGTISDRNGQVLASQTGKWALYFRLSAMDDINQAAMVVSPHIGMGVDEILAQAGKYTTYALIKDDLTMDEASSLTDAIEEAGMQNCINVDKREGRSYASLFHACQLIGFVNREGVGSEGIEYQYDDILSPYPGLGEEVTYGDDITLTLDMGIQYLVDVEVQNIAYEHDPDYIMALVADASTGEVLAMSSYPWYDLNHYNVSTADERLNRTLAYNYEPGSVFKIFTLAKCIEEGIDVTTPFVCDGSETFTVDGSTFTISCHTSHGEVDGRGMIAQSCNGAIASWCLQLSDEDFYDYLRLLGFGSRPDLALPAVSSGFLAPPSSWSARSKATIAFGQEIGVNALQIVCAATALANGGLEMPLSVVKEIRKPDGTVVYQNGDGIVGRRVMDAKTAATLIDYMESAVAEGTAVKAGLDNVRVAAKTGTAEIINPHTGSYADGTNLASTLAIVPADSPRYVVYLAVSAPRGGTVWGADIAAPAVGRIIAGMARQGHIPTSDQGLIQLN